MAATAAATVRTRTWKGQAVGGLRAVSGPLSGGTVADCEHYTEAPTRTAHCTAHSAQRTTWLLAAEGASMAPLTSSEPAAAAAAALTDTTRLLILVCECVHECECCMCEC